MDTLTRLLVICACGLVDGSPLGRLFAQRRDSLEPYAGRYSRQYSPYVYAAIPLHAPVPVLRVLSRAPLRARPDAQAAASALHEHYSRPRATAEPARYYSHFTQHVQHPPPQHERPHYRDSESYRPTRPYPSPEPDYEASAYDYAREYGAPQGERYAAPAPAALEYAAEYDSYLPQPSPLPRLTYALPYEAEPAPTVLYARRSPSGGYTYRRAPTEPAQHKRKPALKEEKIPFIIKIHKYRIVKDDLI